MGACRYCGKPAGIFRRQHKECRLRHEAASEGVKRLCKGAALYGENPDRLKERIREEWSRAGVSASNREIEQNLADGWEHALAEAMEDRLLSREEKRGLNRYRKKFGLSEAQLDRNGNFMMFRKMALLGELAENGTIPRIDRRTARETFGHLPFNLMKSESLVWVFDEVGYAEQVTRREFRGRSMGLSFRVAKGVYVRPGTFRGRSVEETSMEETDSGMFGITTKHLYFAGEQKRFRVRLEKIVSFEPYADGLGIMRDTARAKPEVFLMSPTDGWFAINLIESLLDFEGPDSPRKDAPTLDEIVDEGLDDEDDPAGMFTAGTGLSM